MTDPHPDPRPARRPDSVLAVTAAGLVAVVAAVLPLVPEPYRPWNFAAFGAVGLFAAARGGRFGLVWAAALALGAKVAFDLLNTAQHHADPNYLPLPSNYLGLLAYPLLGWATLRRTDNPLWIAAAAVAGGAVFFLVTNFAAWVDQALPYPRTPAGLLEAYELGLPFHQSTLVSDLAFTAALFGLHAVAVRLAARSPAAVPATAGRS